VSKAVEAKRDIDGDAILRELDALAVAVAPDAPLHAHMVVNAAFWSSAIAGRSSTPPSSA